MAGGAGQRFWPLSTAEYPKQFLDLERSGRSLLQATFDRLAPLADGGERVFVVTGERYAELVGRQLPDLPKTNLMLEPTGRDTAPAIALAALTLEKRLKGPNQSVMGLFPSDHRVGDVPAFQETLRRGVRLARQTNGLVTLGMEPTRPSTAYGYIERGEEVEGGFRVARFVEKPDRKRAEAYLETGLYAWSGGIFLWHVDSILDELRRYVPELMTPLTRAFDEDAVADIFPTLPKVSIDYAVLERTERAFVIPAVFGWDDIGDWEALERLIERDDDANTVVGRHVGYEAKSNIIYTEDDEDAIVTLGVENLVVVKRGNTVLLVRRDRIQDIKKLLQDERLTNLK